MPERGHVALDVVIDAPVERVFDAVTLSIGQRRWLPGLWDTMEITRREPPYRVDVRHTSRVVWGSGSIEVVALPGGRSRLIWSDRLDLPLGTIGRVGWPAVRPALRAGVRRWLAAFGRRVEQGVLPV